MTIDVICPLYNAENYVKELHKNIKRQKNVEINSINYIVTKGNDNTENILNELDCNYEVIEKEEFSHSTARENIARKCKADILVFITQDIIIEREDWLFNLTKCIENGECEASYSRQTCSNNTIEKYTRERNYPDKSFVVSKDDIEKKGVQTFFFSDASSAIKRDIFMQLNCYDGKRLPTNEDMYIAYKLITNGYRIKYCADSIVEHSHKFKLKQLYKRYYDTGVFFKQNRYLNKYKVNQAGGGMAIYILKQIFKEKNYKALFEFLPNMMARFIGMKMGKKDGNINYPKINILIGIITFIISMLFYYNGFNIVSAILLMLTALVILVTDKIGTGYFTNSAGVFSAMWLFTIGLSNLRLHQNQVEWKIDTWLCLIIAFLCFNVGYLLRINTKQKVQKRERTNGKNTKSKRNSLVILTIFFVISFGVFLLEVCMEGYIPMFSNDMAAYKEFGVGKLHFFTVTCTFILPLSYMYYHFYKKEISKKEKWYLIVINIIAMSIPFLIVSRFFIVMTVILTGFAIMELNKEKEILIILIVGIMALFGWNVISNFRNQDETYLKQALNIQDDASLSVNNMQIYMYIAMNYDNFNCNVNEVKEYSYGVKSILPIIELTGLDNKISGAVGISKNANRILTVYNTYPVITEAYFDLGIVGIAIYMMLLGYFAALVENLNGNDILNILLKTLMKYSLLFSFFVSYFSNKTFLFYVLMIGIAKIFLNIISYFELRGKGENG